jgi:excisionase family DNA binding protein
MLTVVILIVFAAAGLVLVLLAVVVVAIRQEPRDVEMSSMAPSLVAIVVQRMLGVYLRRPAPPVDSPEAPPDTWPTAHPPGRRGEKPLQAYTVEQVAKMLHVGRDKVYYLLRTGQLRSLKIGKLRRITEQQLAEFIASLDHAG